MVTVSIPEAAAQLARLIKSVERGEEVVIARAGNPVARLVPPLPEQPRRRLGTMEGRLAVPDTFDDPLPPEVLDSFYKPL